MSLGFNDPAAFKRAWPGQYGVSSGKILAYLKAQASGDGTSAAPIDLGTDAVNAFAQYNKARHTSGDVRTMYLRTYFAGIGGSGETLRAFSTVDGVAVATGGTVNGAHISLSVQGAGGQVSGAGNALRATLGLGAATNPGGTLSALQIDSDFATDATLPSAMCAMRVTNSGVGKWANLLEIPAAANGTMFAAHTTQTMTHSIRIKDAAGTSYYVMCCSAATNRS